MALLDIARPQKKTWARPRRTGWIGVEVGTGAIKVAQVEQNAGQFQIARSLIVRAGENEHFDSRSIEEGRVGREIRKALSTHSGFRGRVAACALSMHFCELRTLVSARGSEDEQRELISLELDGPEAGTEPREFDFWDAAEQRKDEQGMTQVNVVSIPRTLSDSIANNLLAAGLRCQILDGIPFTTLRAVQMSAERGRSNDDPVAVLDWDYSTATLVVIRDDEPLLTRSLRNCGLNRLLEKISQHLKLSFHEAEALLTTYGVDGCKVDMSTGEIQGIITDLAREVLKEIVDELNETLAFLKLQFTNLVPTKVWLMGSGSSVRNIAERLEMQIGIPTALWGHPGRVIDSDQQPSVFGNAVALSALAWE